MSASDLPQKSSLRFRRIVFAVFLGLVIGVPAAGMLYFGVKNHRISRLDSVFAKVRIGDDETEVVRTMGVPHTVRMTDQYDSLNIPQIEGENGGGTKQLCYAVETYFLPVVWVITIDSAGRVRNKFRLD